MIKQIIVGMLIFLGSPLLGKEWTFEISPRELKMCSVVGLHRPQYFIDKCGVKNMVNLSFFKNATFIPPYKDLETSNLKNPKRWPFLTIDSSGSPCIWDSSQRVYQDTKYLASGFPLLVKDGKKIKITKSFFSRRRCPRTAVGIHPNGSMIVYITTRATLKEVQNYFLTIGCTDAINFDGGSSTFLYLNGQKIYSSNQGRSYPNVLYWN